MIPVARPHLTTEDIESVKACLQTGWITQGRLVREFEEKWAAYIGVKHCVMTSSGTTALQLALSAFGMAPGAEVAVPDLTFAAVANAVIAVGAKPVCLDVDKTTWNIDYDRLPYSAAMEAGITVHSYGNPCCRVPFFMPIIEDCSEAHGASINGRKVGSVGLMSVFSFYANKIITTGEGGCVCTNNDKMADRLRLLCNHGMSVERYFHIAPGFNYRMTDMQAALGLSQLRRIDAILHEREAIWNRYNRGLKGLGLVKSEAAEGVKRVNWLYTVTCPDKINRNHLMAYLHGQGIETRPMFRPISSFPYIKQLVCPNAQYLSERGVSLPTYNGLSPEDQDYVIKKVKEYV